MITRVDVNFNYIPQGGKWFCGNGRLLTKNSILKSPEVDNFKDTKKSCVVHFPVSCPSRNRAKA